MSMVLSGIPDPQSQIRSLQKELFDKNRQLNEKDERIAELEASLTKERSKVRQTERGVHQLRTVLNPLHQALGMVFGEIEAMNIQGDIPTQTTAGTDSRVLAVWESWKQKLGEGPAKVIDALLLHREMNTQQLAIATGYHRTTVPTFIYKLNKAGLLNKNGGRFSLREL